MAWRCEMRRFAVRRLARVLKRIAFDDGAARTIRIQVPLVSRSASDILSNGSALDDVGVRRTHRDAASAAGRWGRWR